MLLQTFVSDPANELTGIARNSLLTFAGGADTNLSSATVNGQGAAIYSDQSFATSNGLSLFDGSNAFQVVASATNGTSITNRYAASLPANTQLTFDLNGNLISDGMRRFDYDDFNEMIRVTATNSWKTEYDYDGLMRRHDRRDYLWLYNAWQLRNTTYYVYAGGKVVEEVATATNVAPVVYVYGVGLLERDQGSAAAYYRLDGNGNVTGLFSYSGDVLARYLYDPYGNLLAKSGPLADANRYRFASQEFDPQTGLYAYLYRFYEPNSQRWLNRDPIQENGGINLYGFVANNPINQVDLKGLADFTLVLSYSGTGITDPEGWANFYDNIVYFPYTGHTLCVTGIGKDDVILTRVEDMIGPVGWNLSPEHDRITRIIINGHGWLNRGGFIGGLWDTPVNDASEFTLENLQDSHSFQSQTLAYLKQYTDGHCSVELRLCFPAVDDRGKQFMLTTAQALGASVSGFDDEYAVHGWGNQWTVDPKGHFTMKKGNPFKKSWADW